LPSYISAKTVYGVTNARLDWLRPGSLDGNPANNSALLMLPGGYLPTADARGNASAAPAMDRDGRLTATPNSSNQFIAGWQVQFALAQGQRLQTDTGINLTQSGSNGIVWSGTDVFVDLVIARDRRSTWRSRLPTTASSTRNRATSPSTGARCAVP
jgi:hypothetical protein